MLFANLLFFVLLSLARFLHLFYFLVSVTLLATSPGGLPLPPRPFFSPSLTPVVFFVLAPLHVFGPMVGLVRLAGVAVVCLWRPGIGKVLSRQSRSCKDWGHLNLSVARVFRLQLIVMARPCISSYFNLQTSSISSASFKTISFSTHDFLFKLVQIYSEGIKGGV